MQWPPAICSFVVSIHFSADGSSWQLASLPLRQTWSAPNRLLIAVGDQVLLAAVAVVLDTEAVCVGPEAVVRDDLSTRLVRVGQGKRLRADAGQPTRDVVAAAAAARGHQGSAEGERAEKDDPQPQSRAESYTEERHAAANPAAIFSATPSVLRFVFERGIVGITDASAT